MADFTRRDMLGATAVALMSGSTEAAEDRGTQALPSFRYAMERQKGRVTNAGSAKEATVRQFPVSTGIAGVSMRLKPGGLRELHWHANAAEWAFVIKGRVRGTVIGPDQQSEINDFEAGDVWYFPRGHGHALQCLGKEECHFILVFDNGAFSEYGTFSSTDWLGHTPPAILTKTLGLSAPVAAGLPREELYIVQGRVPPERAPAPRGATRISPLTHRFPLMAQRQWERFPGGTERRVTVREFPISTTMAGVIMDLEPGAVREPHWHPHADEWQYYISGQARMTVFGSAGRARTEEFGEGDAGYVPQGFGHYIENIGKGRCRILVVFDKGDYQEISLSAWLASNPTQLTADNFNFSDAVAQRLPDHRVFIAPETGLDRERRPQD
jgi:oxalate decarboxylase